MSKKKTFPFLAETDQDHGVDDRHQRDEKDERHIADLMAKQRHCRKRAQGTAAHRRMINTDSRMRQACRIALALSAA